MISMTDLTYIVRTAFIARDFFREVRDGRQSSFNLSYSLPPIPEVPEDAPAGRVFLIYWNENNWKPESHYCAVSYTHLTLPTTPYV